VPIVGAERVTPSEHVGVEVTKVRRANEKDTLADFSGLMAACAHLGVGLYAGPFRNVLGNTQGPYYDLDVGAPFIGRWRGRMVSPSLTERNKVGGMEKLLADLFGFASLDIDVGQDNTSFLLEIDGRSYRLADVGAGFAQVFVVLVNAIVMKPRYIFIDEPELNLHPALQLRFLTELATYADNGILFATHNLGLARSITSQIYSVRKQEKGHSKVSPFEATDDLPEMLGELSYGAYQDLGYDTLLLVEGPTELRTIQQLLRKLRKDQGVVLMPMGGRGMINRDRVPELTEIKRVSPGVQILIDSERKAADAPPEPKRQEFVEACKTIGISCTVLKWRAMENYFPDRAVKAAKGQSAHALGPFDDRAGSAWGKNENWLVAREMTADEVRAAGDLGVFLGNL